MHCYLIVGDKMPNYLVVGDNPCSGTRLKHCNEWKRALAEVYKWLCMVTSEKQLSQIGLWYQCKDGFAFNLLTTSRNN